MNKPPITVTVTSLVAASLMVFFIYNHYSTEHTELQFNPHLQTQDVLITEMVYSSISSTETTIIEAPIGYYNSKEDTFKLQNPVITSIKNSTKNFTATAQHGTIHQKKQTAQLTSQVRIDFNDAPNTKLTTKHLNIDLNDHIAHTSETARIDGNWGVIQGIGLFADLDRQYLKLFTSVKSTFNPIK